MPFEPFTCCSIGAAMDSLTTLALAPGNEVDTSTCGGTICGYCAIGRPNAATAPASVMMSEMTVEKMGRSMKKSNMRIAPVLKRLLLQDELVDKIVRHAVLPRRERGFDGRARFYFLHAFDDDGIARLQALVDQPV